MMYESPIKMLVDDMAEKLVKAQENYIVKCVQNVGVNVDKAELKRALAYDRQQYEKGFADGKKEAKQWIPIDKNCPDKRELPDNFVDVLISIEDAVFIAYRLGIHWHISGGGEKFIDFADAWMPAPKSYKEVE